jgi:hypothetical protein
MDRREAAGCVCGIRMERPEAGSVLRFWADRVGSRSITGQRHFSSAHSIALAALGSRGERLNKGSLVASADLKEIPFKRPFCSIWLFFDYLRTSNTLPDSQGVDCRSSTPRSVIFVC